MSPLALAPADFSATGKTETHKKDKVQTIRNEIQEIHANQQSTSKKNLADFKHSENEPVQEFDPPDVQYASLNDEMLGQRKHPVKSEHDELLIKLDKILFLLEEQRDQRTGHVTEEVILYSFIGVFIIFVLDSFARAGKYVR